MSDSDEVYISGKNGEICDCGPLLPQEYLGAAVHMGMRWLAKQPYHWTWDKTEYLPLGIQKFIFRRGLSEDEMRRTVSDLASKT